MRPSRLSGAGESCGAASTEVPAARRRERESRDRDPRRRPPPAAAKQRRHQGQTEVGGDGQRDRSREAEQRNDDEARTDGTDYRAQRVPGVDAGARRCRARLVASEDAHRERKGAPDAESARQQRRDRHPDVREQLIPASDRNELRQIRHPRSPRGRPRRTEAPSRSGAWRSQLRRAPGWSRSATRARRRSRCPVRKLPSMVANA